MAAVNLRQISHVKVAVGQPVNQDLTTILITAYGADENGEPLQFYVTNFDWAPYRGFDMLDVHNVAFPGWVQIQLTGGISKHIAGPRADRPE